MSNFRQRWRPATLFAILGGVFLAAMTTQAATPKPPSLFLAVPGKVSGQLPEKAIAARSRAVKINHGRLRSGRFFLDLPGGVSLEAVRDMQQEFGHNRFAWVGRASGDRRSRVVIGVSGEAVAGTIAYKGKLFKLEPRRGGAHVVSEVRSGDPAPAHDPVPVADSFSSGTQASGDSAQDSGQIIDVLVAYTPRILSIYGESGADALIIQAVAETNQAYANSGIDAHLNLVSSVLTNYTESGSMSTDLSRLRGTGDGYMDELHALRDSIGADMVSLIEDEPQYCGIAYLMSSVSSSFATSAFSVVHRGCATGYYSFAHELGHNQGANHDPANASNAAYSYAYGHQEPFGAFRTVMAYNCPGGCTRVDHFSNPNVLLNGQPTGTSGLSDNARAINATAATVAGFRQGATQTTQSAPSAPSGLNATATGHTTVSLDWFDTSSEETGFFVERSSDGSNFVQIASLAANNSSFLDDNLLAETVYNYRVRAWNSVGNSDYSASATVITEAAPPFTDQQATADLPVAGSVSGNYQATWADDGAYQTISEVHSGGRKRNRYGYLEHKWSFNILPGNAIVLSADVTTTTTGDAFSFSYSTNNSNFVEMFSVDAGNAGAHSFVLPSSLSGTLYVRVRDNVRSAGVTTSHSVRVDHLAIRSDNEVGDPPEAPTGLTATAAGAAGMSINWADMSDNEYGFTLERRVDGSASWLQIATAGADADSYSDTGLSGNTLYYYRVRAFNGAGQSANSNIDSARTDEPPAAASVELSATGYKVKGKQKAELSWSGTIGATVDIYRDNRVVSSSTANSGAYIDNIDRKGGGSYSYKVCAAGTASCSNTTGVAF